MAICETDPCLKTFTQRSDWGKWTYPVPRRARIVQGSQPIRSVQQQALIDRWNEEWRALFGQEGNPPLDVIQKIEGTNPDAWDRYLATRFRKAIVAAIRHPWKEDIIHLGPLLPHELPAFVQEVEKNAAELRARKDPLLTEVLIKERALEAAKQCLIEACQQQFLSQAFS